MKHLDIRVSGKVQGVFFRATTKAVADQLGVKGVVLNEEDGSVFIEAEGDDFALEMLLEFCHKGSDRAQVDKVEVSESAMKIYRNFEVIRRR